MTKSRGLGMGKYARKGKIRGEAAVAETAHYQPSLGVHTRAKALALKRLQESSPQFASSYLHLRSRRLEKRFPFSSTVRSRSAATNRQSAKPNPGPTPSPKISSNQPPGMEESPVNSGSVGSVSVKSRCSNKATTVTAHPVREASSEDGAGVEASFVGENVFELDARRSARETTPCSLIRDPETLGTPPGSTTRPTKFAASNKRQSLIPSTIPTDIEMEELFAGPEQLQQKSFVERYNFDVVKDQPLPGQYEWVKLDS